MSRGGARGGARSGRVGQSYPNRSDLNNGPKLPPTVGPSPEYGANVASVASQQAVPMGPPPGITPPGGGQTGGAPSPQSAAPPVLPGSLGPLHRPSERPGEHVMSGAPTGPGPGPEVLPQTNRNVSGLLDQVVAATGSTALAQLADRARALGQ